MMLYEKLKKVGFTEAMALVYIELLKNPGYNGTQIYKNLKLPRSTIYKALDDLLELEYIFLIPSLDGFKNYNPLEPDKLTNIIKNEYGQILDTVGTELEKIYAPSKFELVYNITGLDNLYYKINEMIENSNKSIVIFGKVIEDRIFNKTKDILFKNRLDENNLTILVDEKEILIANINEFTAAGIYTKNNLIIRKYL